MQCDDVMTWKPIRHCWPILMTTQPADSPYKESVMRGFDDCNVVCLEINVGKSIELTAIWYAMARVTQLWWNVVLHFELTKDALDIAASNYGVCIVIVYNCNPTEVEKNDYLVSAYSNNFRLVWTNNKVSINPQQAFLWWETIDYRCIPLTLVSNAENVCMIWPPNGQVLSEWRVSFWEKRITWWSILIKMWEGYQ